MDFTQVIALLSGIALFLFGMKFMGDGLKSVAGNKLEIILFKLSNTTLKGMLLGTGVTAVIQSSSATSVMVVGFVNSGMMRLRQAVSVILGSILGTSITGWIVSLNYIDGGSGIGKYLSSSVLTGIIAVISAILYLFSKKQSLRHIGQILMGFSILMFGMSTMSEAASVLGETPIFQQLLTSLSNPALGVLFGIVFAAVLQSASAAVGIIQALSVTGSITLGTALPLFMGIAVGAAVPVLLSAFGATVNGKRTSLIYPISNLAGIMAVASLFYIANALFDFSFLDQVADPFSLSAANTFLRMAMVLAVLPFTDLIEAIVTGLIRDKKTETESGPVLEELFLAHPALAVEQSGSAIREMAEQSKKAMDLSIALLSHYQEENYEEVRRLEDQVDRYEDRLGTYLVKLTGRNLTKKQNEHVSVFLHTLSDFERISDHALNVAESAKEIREKSVTFSENAVNELSVLFRAVGEIVRLTTEAFIAEDIDAAKKIEPLEEVIDDLSDAIKLNHVERLQKGECTITHGFVLNDLLTNFERVSDHCSNIAVAMIELDSDAFDTHQYLDRLKQKHSEEFEAEYRQYKEQFWF